jgi:N utilization substance protein A
VFKQEIPELQDNKIEIKGIARDAGWRSKVAVAALDPQIDPIGSCIGQRGGRINTIIEELGGEKIDIIQYSENVQEYLMHAMSPAKVLSVELNEAEKLATVMVAPEQYSLAIGRNGQNVRLASELTGWRINIAQEGGAPAAEGEAAAEPAAEAVEEKTEEAEAKAE